MDLTSPPLYQSLPCLSSCLRPNLILYLSTILAESGPFRDQDGGWLLCRCFHARQVGQITIRLSSVFGPPSLMGSMWCRSVTSWCSGQRQHRCIASTSNLSRTALGIAFRFVVAPSRQSIHQRVNLPVRGLDVAVCLPTIILPSAASAKRWKIPRICGRMMCDGG